MSLKQGAYSMGEENALSEDEKDKRFIEALSEIFNEKVVDSIPELSYDYFNETRRRTENG